MPESSLASAASTVPLKSQVGGHAGVMTTEDGSLVIKPSLPLEHQFYEALKSDEKLAPLKPFTPEFLGTLRLEGEIDPNASSDQGLTLKPVPEGEKPAQKESLVLENLSYRFLKPNILDIKLGTILYDESANAEKIARAEKQAHSTTSFETGVRLTGFQVYDNLTSNPVNTPKDYGRSIKPADLPEGIARFFPVAPPSDPPPTASSGLPLHTLLPVLRGIRKNTQEIRDVFASIEVRMVAGSLLIIYESDWERAEEGLKKLAEDADHGDGDDEDEESDDEDGEKKIGPPFLVKVIDFAHTRLCPGKGSDEGVLKGIDTTLRLLDGRINQLNDS